MDAESPARVPFLSQLGQPFNSTFRPQEALTAQVMDGAVRAIDALHPDAVIQGGDLIDNAQENELIRGLALLAGGRVDPGSGARRYHGVQEAGDADPFYYRPDIDAPRHPGLLAAATRRFHAAGLKAPWYPVLGDHDLLVQGILAPTALTDRIARGGRAVWRLPTGLKAPPGASDLAAAAPDGLPDPGLFEPLIRQLLTAPAVDVPADPTPPRAERRDGGRAAAPRRLAAPRRRPARLHLRRRRQRLRVIVLDLVRREGGSDGLVHAGQSAWLARQLARAGDRWVLVVTHQPLTNSVGGVGRPGAARPPPARRRGPLRPHPQQPDRAPPRPRRRLLADLDRLADRLSPAGPRPAPLRDRRRRSRAADLDARPRPRRTRRHLPRTLLPRRPGRPAAGLRRRLPTTAT